MAMTTLSRIALAFFLALFAAGPGAAQVLPPVPLPTEPPPAAGAQPPPPRLVRERAYYIPYSSLKKVFEKKGRGIFLPYEEFLELWRKARGVKPPKPAPAPPAPAVLRGGRFVGKVEGKIATLSVTFGVESLKKGWSELALPIRGGAVAKARVTALGPDDKPLPPEKDPGALFVSRGSGYAVLCPSPGRYEVALELRVAVTERPGEKQVRLGVPKAAVTELDLTIPGRGLDVKIEPSIVATRTEAAGDSTRVIAFLGNTEQVSLRWRPPVGAVKEEEAIVLCSQEIHAQVGERTLRVSAALLFRLLRGETDTFRIRLPKDMRLLKVEGEGIREWAPTDGALVVRLHQKAKKQVLLSLAFERLLTEKATALEVPFPRAEKVLRESGVVVLGHDPSLSVRVEKSPGLSQLDPQEVPSALRPYLGTGFRYLVPPIGLSLRVARIVPVVRAETASVIALGRDEDVWFGRIDFTIQKAGVFQLAFRVPKAWAVDEVGDPKAVDAVVAEIDGEMRTVRVNLRKKALGSVSLPFRLVREGHGRAGAQTLTPPQVLGAEQDRGLLGVSAPRELEITTGDLQRLVPADAAELVRTGILGQLSDRLSMPLAYRYREAGAEAKVSLAPRKTVIEVSAQHLVSVQDAELRLTHLLDYRVLHAPIPALRFQAPTALDEELKVEADKKTDVTRRALEGGLTEWTVRFQPPVLGAVTIVITHPLELGALALEEPRRFQVPLIQPVGAQSVQGFVAIQKEGTLEIEPLPEGMEPIDASFLPDKLRRGQVYSAFRYFAKAPALALALTRYRYEELATAVVELLRVRAVLAEEGMLKAEVTLLVQNTERQYLELELGQGARVLTAAVNGRRQTPRRRKEGKATLIQIPRSAGPGGMFRVTLTYEVQVETETLGRFGTLTLPPIRVGDGVPISKTELELSLPPELCYGGFRGTLHRRQSAGDGLWPQLIALLAPGNDQPAPATGAPRRSRPSVNEAIVVDVPTDGYLRYTFDTLAPEGTLRFWYAARWIQNLAAFALLVLAAAACALALRRPGRRIVRAVPAIFIAFLLLGPWGGPAGAVAHAAAAGIVLAVCGIAVLAGFDALRALRARRRVVAPDPFLEEPAVGVSTSVSAAPASPAPPEVTAPAAESPAVAPPVPPASKEAAAPSPTEGTPAPGDSSAPADDGPEAV